MQTQHVKVLRAFYINRHMHKPGEEVELPRINAIELVAAGKAELLAPKPQKNLDLKQPDAVKPPPREKSGKQ